MEQKYLQQDSSINIRRAALEQFTQEYTAHYLSRLQQRAINSDTVLFVIPVVFHVMHNYGTENISKAQILDALRIVNEDFQKRNADTTQIVAQFKSIIGNAQVEFRLAKLDPMGNCTDGITRHPTNLTNGGDDLVKQIVHWPADSYLNIWVTNFCNGASAYAYLPGIADTVDGIVIMDERVGSIGTGSSGTSSSRTLSHESGHYLNLWHTWGQNNNAGLASNCLLDDFVFDTPNTAGGGCSLNQSSCNTGIIDNVQNTMDYCSEQMFTIGQVARMQAALNSNISHRDSLWTPTNRLRTGTNDGFLSAVCAPLADFSNKQIRICQGQSVTFYNSSYAGDFTAIHWQFTGGNITASTDTNPTVTYANVGLYDVTLTITNSAGTSTLTRQALVNVGATVPALSAPTQQNFETLIFPSVLWNVENETGAAWAITNTASVSGTHSLFLKTESSNFTTDDIFYTENYNLSNVAAPTFTFKIAAQRHNSFADGLKIFMSTDCGQSWNLRYAKTMNSLVTTNDTASTFLPTANQWRLDGATITAAAGQQNVGFKFQFTAQGSNTIFIDDINIGGTTGIENLTANDIGLTVYPNPAGQQAEITFETLTTSSISYALFNVSGQKVFETKPEIYLPGRQSFMVHKLFDAGFYFLKLKIDEQELVSKIVFTN